MTIRVFVSGQSNALGRAAGGPSWSTIDSRVRVWNNVNPLGANGSTFTDPVSARAGGTFDNLDRNNLGVWFCDKLARYADDDVDMTIVARGASSITLWDPAEATYPMLQECIDVWAATGQPPADVFLWHQGEANAGSSDAAAASYQDRFLALVANLTAGGVIGDNTRIIVGGLSEENMQAKLDFNRKALRALSDLDRRIGYASSTNLLTTDGTHFTGDALRELGAERYFSAYRQLAPPPLFALVNSGGTPGVAGSGENRSLFVGSLRNGYKLLGQPRILTFDQIYSPPSSVAAIYVEVLGGGGGGGAGLGSDGVPRAASGGGAGGWASAFIEAPEPEYAVVIGAGGAGAPAGVTGSATTGGTTTFGTVLVGNGGGSGFGSGSASSPVMANGGSAGWGTGQLVGAGEAGGMGVKLADTSRTSGNGGSSRYGRGGLGRSHASTSGGAGRDGNGYGSGGSGATSSTTDDYAGGNGRPGVVVVWEYVR